MSKFIRVSDGNYTISVSPGNTITLDTGSNDGDVIVTGDLTVMGVYQIIGHQAADITDTNLIILDPTADPDLNGKKVAGLDIDLTAFTPDYHAYLIYDTVSSGFVLKDTADNKVPLITDTIQASESYDSDLILLGGGSKVVSVTGTTNYEQNLSDDDDIPNKKYVDDKIVTQIEDLAVYSDQLTITSTDDGNPDTIDTIAKLNINALEYIINATDSTGHYYRTSKILIQQTNTDVLFTEYALLKNNDNKNVVEYSCIIDGSNIKLNAYCTDNSNIDISFTRLKC